MQTSIQPPRLKNQHSPPKRSQPFKRPHGIFQISIFPDNAIKIHYRSESPAAKNWGDKVEQKRLRERGRLIHQREWIDGILKRIGSCLSHQEYQPSVLPRNDGESLQAYSDRKLAFQADWIEPFRFPVPVPCKCDQGLEVSHNGETIMKPKLYWLPLDGYGSVGHLRETYKKSDLIEVRSQICELLSNFAQNESLTSPANFRTFSDGILKPKRRATFTKRAARTVRSGGGAIDKLCPQENTYFLTLTCPGSSTAAENAFRENLSYIKKRLTDRVLDRMKRNDCTLFSFYSVEVGQKGFKKAHIHWCISSPDWESEKVRALAHSMKDLWYQVLAEISDDTGIDLFERYSSGKKTNRINSWRNYPSKWQWRIERVTKSVGAYLSKYASKAVSYSKRQSEFSLGDKGRDCPLKRWWGMNNKLRQAIRNLSFKSRAMRINQLNPDLQELISDLIGCFEYELAYSSEYMILTDDKQFSLVNGQHDIYYLKSDCYTEALEAIKGLVCVFEALEQRNLVGSNF